MRMNLAGVEHQAGCPLLLRDITELPLEEAEAMLVSA